MTLRAWPLSPSREHLAQAGLREEQRAAQIDAHHGVEILRREVEHVAALRRADAGIVDEHVEPPNRAAMRAAVAGCDRDVGEVGLSSKAAAPSDSSSRAAPIASSPSGSRSGRARSNPPWASSSAMARPMPRPAPVTTATGRFASPVIVRIPTVWPVSLNTLILRSRLSLSLRLEGRGLELRWRTSFTPLKSLVLRDTTRSRVVPQDEGVRGFSGRSL